MTGDVTQSGQLYADITYWDYEFRHNWSTGSQQVFYLQLYKQHKTTINHPMGRDCCKVGEGGGAVGGSMVRHGVHSSSGMLHISDTCIFHTYNPSQPESNSPSTFNSTSIVFGWSHLTLSLEARCQWKSETSAVLAADLHGTSSANFFFCKPACQRLPFFFCLCCCWRASW